ncbi:MAG: sel1 repeat family protein [Myxococcales bacterium]|nr:sel1 repeat family protein [Myxococcales bacterium]
MRPLVVLGLMACTPKPVSVASLQPGSLGALSVSAARDTVCPGDEIDVEATVTTRGGVALRAATEDDWRDLRWTELSGLQPLKGGALQVTGRPLGEVTGPVAATLVAGTERAQTARLTVDVGPACAHRVDLSGTPGTDGAAGGDATAVHVRVDLGRAEPPLLRVVVSNGTVTRPLTLDPTVGSLTVLARGGAGDGDATGGRGGKAVITLGPGAERFAHRIRIRNEGGAAGNSDAPAGAPGGPPRWQLTEPRPQSCGPELPFGCLEHPDSSERRDALREACHDGWLAACRSLEPVPPHPFEAPLRAACDAALPDACMALHPPSSEPFGDLTAGLRAACSLGVEDGCLWAQTLSEDAEEPAAQHAELLAAWADCERGSVAACARAGVLAAAEEADAVDRAALGRTGLGRACAAKHASACTGLAWFFESGRASTPVDAERAIALYERGCALGDLYACTSQGWMTQHGDGVEADRDAALALYRRACDGGDGRGCGNAGALFLQGTSEDRASALQWFERGCVLEHGPSCVAQGDVFSDPETEPSGVERAAELYGRACELGAASGCNQLGIAHETGRGAPRDPATAAVHYDRACVLGNGVGCSNLGALFQFGRGMVADATKALELYRRACELGSGAGCTNLGYLTENGLGQPADRTAAMLHYETACELGDDTGCANLAILQAQQPPGP